MTESLKNEELTICTVSFGHKDLIEANIELTGKMNPGRDIRWIIVENTPDDKSGTFTLGERGNIKVIKGIQNDFKGVGSASYHHASGLNRVMGEVTTRYALVLDPDFFILRKNWAKDIMSHMERYKLAFFGVPYNPKRYMKYRGFPCIHCMFIDLDKVNKEEIDFNPSYKQSSPDVSNRAVMPKDGGVARNFFNTLKRHVRIALKRSSIIGSSRDTGYGLFERFHTAENIRSECATPVFKPHSSSIKPSWIGSVANAAIERFLPENLCYLPKDHGYYSERGFKESGFEDVFGEGWDEFIWKGEPFGFHLQGANKDGTTKDHSGETRRLSEILDNFYQRGRVKNVFFAMFEGVESKNILRTGIVKKVLASDSSTRAVLFMKNKERAEYYAKEFSDPRIIYEVIDAGNLGFADRIFSFLKFKFLQTETTDLRAKMIREERGVVYYYYSLVLHRILARSFFVSLFRWLDLILVRNISFDSYFERYNPTLILLANLFEDHETNFLRAAKKYSVFSVGLINSWDRVTARCVLRVLPDKLIVFNSTVKKEVIETNYVEPADIFISGLPQYDYYFSPIRVARKDFLRKLGLEDDERIVFYSPIGGMFSNSDWEMIDLLYSMNSEGKFGEKVKIFVSFPPNDFIKEEELRKRPWLPYQYIGTRFSSVRSTDWDIKGEELEDLKNLLFHASIVLCYASSLSIDAAIFDKPIININFEIKDNESLSKSPTAFYKMTHYEKALHAGGIRLVNNESELIEWIRRYLEDPSVDRDGRKRLVERQCEYTDGKSADRIAGYLCSFLGRAAT
ncbi:MAG: CDP-glycerol glycerophosphotransferase family protein [Candidatus Paceibacterota bacterium]|jgi:hypothetical protein